MRIFLAHNKAGARKPAITLAAAVQWIRSQIPAGYTAEIETEGEADIYAVCVKWDGRIIEHWYVEVQEVAGLVVDSPMFTLYDDESVREKLTVMTPYEAMIDDARNPDTDFEERVNNALTFGKKYQIFVAEVE